MSLPVCAQNTNVILTGNTALATNEELWQSITDYCSDRKTQPVIWVLNGDVFDSKKNKEELLTVWQKQVNSLLDEFENLHIIVNQGDKEWSNSGKKGLDNLRSIEKQLQKNKHSRFHLYFNRGCPGPYTLAFANVTFVVINSQWWNHPYEKPIASDAACPVANTDVFIEELEEILDESATRNVIFLSHFPLVSLGNYGGHFALVDYLFPPLIGDIQSAFHQNIGNSKDIINERFNPFRIRLAQTLQNYSSVVFASGHERNHSILKAGKNYYINSGALGSGDYVANYKHALLTSSQSGFIELSYYKEGKVDYQLLSRQKDHKNNKGTLMTSPCQSEFDDSINTRVQCSKQENSETQKSITLPIYHVAGGPEYKANAFKELWLGKHYRDSWTIPVTVYPLNMDSIAGGLRVNGKGGGRQTTSLKLTGANGKEYVFRSVDKDPSKALATPLRQTIVSEFLKDQTTTQHPYGAMVVSPLLDQIDILHAHPALYVLPDDERLGSFRKSYSNLFGMLEERPNDKIEKSKIFGGATAIEKSNKFFEKLHQSHDNRVDKDEFIRARLFDLWIGDWSKHEDNWKWAGYPNRDGGMLYRPIPRDRDHAFSRWDGILPWLADREWAMPNGENFDYKIKGLRSLMWQARHLDRYVASECSESQWVQQAIQIQQSITDDEIENAVKQMPSEAYSIHGKEIEAKLKARLKDLSTYAKSYYKLLAEEVEVVGSNQDEYFHIKRNKDASVSVHVYGINKHGIDSTHTLFSRVFSKNETKEIRLFGLNGDDEFLIAGHSEKSIPIRIISGKGHDIIADRSDVRKGKKKTLIYEQGATSSITTGNETVMVDPPNRSVYDYDRTLFKYKTYLPFVSISYNPFTKLALHGEVTFTNHRFGKPDFNLKQKIKGSIGTEGNYELSYENQLRYLIGKWDGISKFEVSRPLQINYFYGIGNDTKQESERSTNYYRAQYEKKSATLGLRRKFWKQSYLTFSSTYELDKGFHGGESYLEDHPDVLGTEQLQMIFINGSLDLDFRDRQALPEHGFRLVANHSTGHISKTSSSLATISDIEIENYFSTYTKNPVTIGIRAGGGFTTGELPFYKLFSLGQLNNLQGFKRNRFTGQSKAFLNSELRWQLFQKQNAFIPFKSGVRGFFDVGRVWADDDIAKANIWHYGFGGGFYITPFMEQFAFNISAGTSKEQSFLLAISVGAFFR